MKKTLLYIVCLFCFINLQAQNISGIVNSYHKVLEPEEISAGNEVAISLDDASALVEGQRVLIIQMKGAIVNTSESDSFGDIESLNNAGN